MNNLSEYRTAMDGISFSDRQKEALTAALTRTRSSAKPRIPVLRAALIAAIVCLVLAGTALAVTSLHSAAGVNPFAPGGVKEELGVSNPGYTVTYEARRLPLSDFSDRILSDAANLSSEWPIGFDSWEEAEAYIGFDLMNNRCLAEAEAVINPYLLEGDGRAHATVQRYCREGILSSVGVNARYIVTENGIPVLADLYASASTEALPADVDISKMNYLYTMDKTDEDQEVYELTGSNGLTVTVIADPDEVYSTYYAAYFSANGVRFAVYVQYVFPNTDASHEEGNAAAAAVLQAVIDGVSF